MTVPPTQSKPLQTVLDHVDEIALNEDSNVADVIEDFGDRSFGPILILCGVILFTPIGAIPGMPLAIFLVLSSFAVHILLERDRPWLPDFIGKIELHHGHIRKTKEFLRPYLRRVDGLVRPRWPWAAGKTCRKLAAMMVALLAATLIPLGPIPFAATLPGAIIMIFGLGFTARDGALISLAMALTAFPVLLLCSKVML